MSTDPETVAEKPSRRRWRMRLKRAVIGLCLAGVSGLALIIGGEYYTARPSFCGSCHIMDRYYRSWTHDAHAGDMQVACVECHYAPGEQHTVKAKLRGLSQVFSYFSGRSDGGRLRSRAASESCLTADCHGDGAFMTVELELGNATFRHDQHLAKPTRRAAEIEQQFGVLRHKLLAQLHPDVVALIDREARGLRRQPGKAEELQAWLARQTPSLREDVLAFVEAQDMKARVDQLANLGCASCHRFDVTGAGHFVASKDVCYLCHFIQQPINQGTAKCATCHKPPGIGVVVHRAQSNDAVVTKVVMNHTDIVAQEVDCAVCHAGLVSGTGQVSRQTCGNCHTEQRILDECDHLTADRVREVHRLHTSRLDAHCGDCHEWIRHGQLPDLVAEGKGEFLAASRRLCEDCHPDHHQEQVDLLLGRGGVCGRDAGAANPMAEVQATCRACHVKLARDSKDGLILAAGAEACRDCHTQDYAALLDRWRTSLGEKLARCEEVFAEVNPKAMAATRPAGDQAEEARQLCLRARRNIDLTKHANGLHNPAHAHGLLDQALADLAKAQGMLVP